MFVWVAHRVTGLLLILILALQITSGFISGGENLEGWRGVYAKVHKNNGVNTVILLLVIFHALYGLRTILVDMGMKRERLLFWLFNILGIGLFVIGFFAFIA